MSQLAPFLHDPFLEKKGQTVPGGFAAPLAAALGFALAFALPPPFPLPLPFAVAKGLVTLLGRESFSAKSGSRSSCPLLCQLPSTQRQTSGPRQPFAAALAAALGS